MLPFLNKKKEASISATPESITRAHDEDSDYGMLDAVAEDILSAIEKKDAKSLKMALESLCEHIQALDEKQDKEL